MLDRSARWFRQLLVSVDQLAYVLIAGPIYIIWGGPTPSADETISSRVGRAAIAGKRWGLICERLIDGLFVLLGGTPGHCRRNVETAFLNLPPTR